MRKPVLTKEAVSVRLNVTSLEVNVDRAMRYLPRRLDLAQPKTREQFRDWLLTYSQHLASSLQYDFSKAADLGMKQMATLIRSPAYREVVREREARIEDRNKSDIVKKVRQQRRKVEADKRLSEEGRQ